MKQQNLEFLLHSDIEPKEIRCDRFLFPKGDVTDYSTVGREKHLLHLTLRGKREYIRDGKRQVFDEHSVVFIPDGTNYLTCPTCDSEICEGITLLFSIEDSLSKSIPHGIYQINSRPQDTLEKHFFELCELCTKMPTQKLRKKILALELLHGFIAEHLSAAPNSRLIAPALSYLAEHYKENIPVSRYAAVCHLSESYFRRVFSEITGMSPIDYRNKLRFYEARRLYQNGLSASEIAETIGFCDEGYFLKLYRRSFGKSFRKESKYL